MNCFEWSHRVSDFLDGTLIESDLKATEVHLKSCEKCKSHLEHYRSILNVIDSTEKARLPEEFKKNPFKSPLPRPESSTISISTWERIPWYFRTILQTVGIVSVTLFGISSTPTIRKIYEKNIEQTLSEFKETIQTSLSARENDADELDPSLPPLQQGHPGLTKTALEGNDSSNEDELSGEDEDDEFQEKKVKVGRSQLWRFTLKTVSPDELRPRVVKVLSEIGIPADTPNLGGIQVPGGIEFDLVVPVDQVPEIKIQMEKLAPKPAETNGKVLPGTETFSWYRVKSRRKIPDGKSQVVIWLAQPNP